MSTQSSSSTLDEPLHPFAYSTASAPGRCRAIAALSGGFAANLAIGAVYGWGVIAKHVGDLGYDASDKLTMGTMGSLAVYISLGTGQFFDRFGARAAYLLGLVLTVGGWLLTSWALSRRSPAWVVGLFQVIVSQGCQPVILAALEAVKSFDSSKKGACNGFVMAGFGLTSVVIAQVDRLYPDTEAGLHALLTHMAIGSAVLITIGLLTHLPPPPIPKHGGTEGSSVMKELAHSRDAHLLTLTILAFAMALFNFVVNSNDYTAASSTPFNTDGIVTCFSVANVIARPAIGLASDKIPFSRAQLYAVGSTLATASMLLLAMQYILPAAIVIGIADGLWWASMAPLVCHVHGTAHFGAYYSWYFMCFGLGDVLINFAINKTFLTPTTTTTLGHTRLFVSPLICAAATLLGVAAALLLHRRLARRGHAIAVQIDAAH